MALGQSHAGPRRGSLVAVYAMQKPARVSTDWCAATRDIKAKAVEAPASSHLRVLVIPKRHWAALGKPPPQLVCPCARRELLTAPSSGMLSAGAPMVPALDKLGAAAL